MSLREPLLGCDIVDTVPVSTRPNGYVDRGIFAEPYGGWVRYRCALGGTSPPGPLGFNPLLKGGWRQQETLRNAQTPLDNGHLYHGYGTMRQANCGNAFRLNIVNMLDGPRELKFAARYTTVLWLFRAIE